MHFWKFITSRNKAQKAETALESVTKKAIALEQELHTVRELHVLSINDRIRLKEELRETRSRFDLVGHIKRQRAWSDKTFGPGERHAGVVDHIRKELKEIEQDPKDLAEWVDVIILAIDGATRMGHSAEAIVSALQAKQVKNESRKWPDWRTMDPNKAIEHVREEHELKPVPGFPMFPSALQEAVNKAQAESRLCPNGCGQPGPHYVPPFLGEMGFFVCASLKAPHDANGSPVEE